MSTEPEPEEEPEVVIPASSFFVTVKVHRSVQDSDGLALADTLPLAAQVNARLAPSVALRECVQCTSLYVLLLCRSRTTCTFPWIGEPAVS